MIRKSTEKDLKQITTLKTSSKEQNHYLFEQLTDQEIAYADCYVCEKNGRIQARAVLEKEALLLLTIDDLTQEEANSFIAEVTKDKQLETTLYFDKQNFDVIQKSLLESGFYLLVKREHYECLEFEEKELQLNYCSLETISEELLIDLFERVQEGHLDPLFQQERGKDYFKYLKEIEFTPALWLIAYQDTSPVGFLVLQNYYQKELVLNYIGVLPEYRGNHYSADLIRLAHRIALSNGYTKIIAEIDQHNFPLKEVFLTNNFILENELIRLKKE